MIPQAPASPFEITGQLTGPGTYPGGPFNPGNWQMSPPADSVGGQIAGGNYAGAAGTLLGINPGSSSWSFAMDVVVGLAAVGTMLIGLWLIAGAPKPQAVPVPVPA